MKAEIKAYFGSREKDARPQLTMKKVNPR
jgi:hypothetical protein